MGRPRKGSLDFTAWIALSAAQYPAPFIGLAFTRSELRRYYQERFGGTLEEHGYTAVKVRICGFVPSTAVYETTIQRHTTVDVRGTRTDGSTPPDTSRT